MQDQNLKQKVINALKWVLGGTIAVQLISWVITIYVIRLLNPDDMGLMGIAFVFIGALSLISELGLSYAVIQKRDITEYQLRQVLGFVILGNLFFFFLVLISAKYIANFYDESRLTPILMTLSVIFLMRPFYVINETLLAKEMKFKLKSMVNLISNVSAAFTALILAKLGYGVWALIWNQLMLYLTRVVCFNIASKGMIRPSFNFNGSGQLLTFGSYSTGASFFRSLFFKLDVMIGGKLLSVGPIGVYSVALQLSTIVLDKLSIVIPQIAFPAFSIMQSDSLHFASTFLKAGRFLYLISFPCFCGIAAISPEIVALFLGDKWLEVIFPMRILCLVMPLRMLDLLYYPAMVGKGRADICMLTAILTTIVLAFAFLIGARWGIEGLCWAWVAGYPIVYAFMLYMCQRILNIKFYEILRTMMLPVSASLVMYLSIYLLRSNIVPAMTITLRLVVFVISGAAIVAGVFLTVNRNLLSEFRSLIKNSAY